MTGQVAFDRQRYRQVLGHFCTGVTVITAVGPEGPIGFACQSFAALSLDPPLVLFCPGKTSRSWPVIESAGTFCVNLLAEHQSEVSARFGAPGKDKFSGIPLYASPSGNPIIDGALTWIDCTVHAVHDGGDHFLVLGHVAHLGPVSDGKPLLFNRGSYTGLTGRPVDPAPVAMEFDELLALPASDDWL